MNHIVTATLLTMAIVLGFLLAVIAISALFDLDGVVGPASIVAAGGAGFVYMLLERRRRRG